MTDERADSPASIPLRDPKESFQDALTTPFLANLPITGVAISVFDQGGRQSTIAASDAIATRLDEAQFDLGEGPHWLALRTGQPVIISTFADAGLDRWPAFAEVVLDLNVSSLFAFPMSMGAVTVGVVDLYCAEPTNLTAEDFGAIISLVTRITPAAVREALIGARNHRPDEPSNFPAMRREVHQATGMILVQLNISATEAFLRLRAHAFSAGRSVQDVAHDVVAHTLDFSAIPD